MVISRTPYRMSFFGGGTDFPEYYLNYGEGGVISTTIDKYCYISVRCLPKYFKHKHRIVYSKIELVNNIHQIQHPVIKEILLHYNVFNGLEIHHDGDVPAQSGLGTSSSFTVGMINALSLLIKQKSLSKRSLSNEALHLEQTILKENVGSQDQISVAHGGLNNIIFKGDGNYTVNPLKLTINNQLILQDHLMLFFTGQQRRSDDIEKDKIKNININSNMYKEIKDIQNEALKMFLSGKLNIKLFGDLINQSWLVKKNLSSNVSNELIDNYITDVKKLGAYGGKILGAGGGGFLLFVAPPEIHKKIEEKLKNLTRVFFKFENSGSQIIFNGT